MASTNADLQKSDSPSSTDAVIWGGIFDTAKTGIVSYFSAETAKNLAKAPPANTAIIVGGIAVLGVIVAVILLKK